MDDNLVYIGYGGGLVAIVRGGPVWGADSPAELIAKLDAEGIDRGRLYLIMADGLCCPDHALHPRDVEAFIEILGADVRRGS